MVTQTPPVPGAENVVVRRSRVHGRGLFARRDIEKGEWIVEYAGRKVSKKEGSQRTEQQWQRGTVFIFELNSRWDIDGTPLWNKARYANHSCDPNCETQNTGREVWVVALRDIKEGDEITYDYNFPVEEEMVECRCGAKKCRGWVVAEDSVDEMREWVREHGLKMPPGLRKRT